MNKIQIIGRLTGDPELRTTPNGVQVCTFSVAVGRKFNRDETDFFPVTVWREMGVNCNKYLTKGSQVGVCGTLQIRRYEDKDGIKRQAIDLQADEVEFLGSKNENSQAAPKSNKSFDVSELEVVDDDGNVPF